jgi:uncharacterized RDD family membrane protein YckC
MLFGKPLASVGQRVSARLVDGLVFLPFLFVVVGLESALRAVSGVDAGPEGDWVSNVTGMLTLVGLIAYDPVLTRLARGATPGKRTQRLRVVLAEDGSPPSTLRLVGRNALLVLEWVTIVPGVIDLSRAAQDGQGRSWIDRAMGTAVLREAAMVVGPGSGSAAPMSGGPTPLIDPWASLAKSAAAARDRFSGNIALGGPGPLRERLDDIERRVAECEAECFRIAIRGHHLTATAADLDLDALRARAETARVAADADPSDVDRRTLADAYSEELESAERLDRLAAQTEVKLRQLVAELNSVANQALELTMAPTSGVELSALVDQLDALREALTEVDNEVGA